jgi:hypothetical protein
MKIKKYKTTAFIFICKCTDYNIVFVITVGSKSLDIFIAFSLIRNIIKCEHEQVKI